MAFSPAQNDRKGVVMKGVSIIMPCFNSGSDVLHAVESVHDQRMGLPYEIIVINDGSTCPVTLSAVRHIARTDSKASVITLPRNLGQSQARNIGLGRALYDYILPLDADDMLDRSKPGYVEKAIDLLARRPELITVYSRYREIGADPKPCSLPFYDEKNLLMSNMIPVYGVYRREEALRAGGYKSDLHLCEDWEFWIALHAQRFRDGKPRHAICLETPHYLYRQHTHGRNVSATPITIEKGLRSNMVRNADFYSHVFQTDNLLELILHSAVYQSMCQRKPSFLKAAFAIAKKTPSLGRPFIKQSHRDIRDRMGLLSAAHEKAPHL